MRRAGAKRPPLWNRPSHSGAAAASGVGVIPNASKPGNLPLATLSF